MGSSKQEIVTPIPTELQDALHNFDHEALRIVGRWLSELEGRSIPTVMYHYTTDAGLRGILGSGKLWLTDIFALNDPSELRHGFSLATDILDDEAKKGPDEYRLFAENFRDALEQEKEGREGIERSAHYFVCSFSKDGNDLGQWRAYADDGHGYALEFDASPLEKAFTGSSRAQTTAKALASNGEGFPVTYSDIRLSDLQRRMIQRVLPLTSLPHGRSLTPDALLRYWAALLTKCAVHLLHASVYFKHEAYSNEKEYRFLEMHRADLEPRVERRIRNYQLIKYREFDWRTAGAGAGILKKILVGPAADYEKARAFAEQCLRDFGYTDVPIVPSGIPYRSYAR